MMAVKVLEGANGLGVQQGNEITVYGTFTSTEAADRFMVELAKLVGAVEKGSET